MGDDASRTLAIACMLLASRDRANDGSFNGDPEYIKRFAYLNAEPCFKHLIKYQFIECLQDASKTLDECNTEKRREEAETEAEKRKPSAQKSAPEYSDVFEFAWAIYPKRPGANKKETYKAWNARLKAGASVEAMTNGVKRYAAFCKAQNTEPQYIKQAATFFGPSEHYLSDWKPPAQSRPVTSKEAQLDTADQIFRRGKYADDRQARGFAIGNTVEGGRAGIPEILDGVWESSIEQVERDEYD